MTGIKNMIAKFLKSLASSLVLSLMVAGAQANEGGLAWDKFPVEKVTDNAALQNGAKLFVNYCLNCHAAAYMRYCLLYTSPSPRD